MTATTTFEKKDNYILCVLDGEYTIQDFTALVIQLDRATDRYNCRNVLFHKLAYYDNFDFHEAIVLADSHMTEFIVDKRLRIAAVIRPDYAEIEKQYEALMLNRSFNYKPFDNFEEAEEWLRNA